MNHNNRLKNNTNNIPTQRSNDPARLPYRSLNGGQSDDSLCKATLDNETNVKVQYLLPTKFELHNILALIISQ